MKRKFLKEIYYAGDVYTFWSCKLGILVNVNDKVSCNPLNNVREAIRWVQEYSEFVLGKHMLKDTEPYEDKYVTDKELKSIGEVTDTKILEIIKEREKRDNKVRYSIKDLEFISKDISCKYYNFNKKECMKHNKVCYMCNDYKV